MKIEIRSKYTGEFIEDIERSVGDRPFEAAASGRSWKPVEQLVRLNGCAVWLFSNATIWIKIAQAVYIMEYSTVSHMKALEKLFMLHFSFVGDTNL